MLTNNTPILIGTHLTGLSDPFFGDSSIQNAINNAIDGLFHETGGEYGGNFKPTVVDIDDVIFKGAGDDTGTTPDPGGGYTDGSDTTPPPGDTTPPPDDDGSGTTPPPDDTRRRFYSFTRRGCT